MKKTVCIYHSRDLDGWMSAAIVKKWFEKQEKHKCKTCIKYHIESCKNCKNFSFYKPNIDFLGWDYGDDIPDLSEYDKVIMCDISFPQEEMFKLYDRLEDDFIWIDHHISAMLQVIGSNKLLDGHYDDTCYIEGERDTKYAACELTWKYFFPDEEMPETVRLLGRYDCFGHKGTYEEQKVLEFQYGARSLIFNYEDAYNALNDSIQYHKLNHSLEFTSPEEDIIIEGEHIYKYLCNEAKQTYENRFEIKLEEPEVFTSEFGSTNTVIRKFLCINQERFNPINFGIDYHKDGYDGFACFWYKDGKWIFSLYNDNGLVDCSKIAKQYNGGGHKGAAGFIIDNINDLNKMIRENN